MHRRRRRRRRRRRQHQHRHRRRLLAPPRHLRQLRCVWGQRSYLRSQRQLSVEVVIICRRARKSLGYGCFCLKRYLSCATTIDYSTAISAAARPCSSHHACVDHARVQCCFGHHQRPCVCVTTSLRSVHDKCGEQWRRSFQPIRLHALGTNRLVSTGTMVSVLSPGSTTKHCRDIFTIVLCSQLQRKSDLLSRTLLPPVGA